MSRAALVVYVVGLLLTFGLRTWTHLRTTGSSGFNGIREPAGSPGWWGGVLFAVALLLGVAAPAVDVAGLVSPPMALDATAVRATGLCVAVLSLLGVLAAQAGMGASWRIGVDPTEHTALVTAGIFAHIRNPIFTAMVLAQLGMLLAVPTWLSVLAVAALVGAVELQVRAVEEPYLLDRHGATYRRYAATTGRFFPGVGKGLAAN